MRPSEVSTPKAPCPAATRTMISPSFSRALSVKWDTWNGRMWMRSPQQYTRPLFPSAMEQRPPAAMSTMASSSAGKCGTTEGMDSDDWMSTAASSPRPSWPWPLRPQHHTRPSTSRASVNPAPTAMREHLIPSSSKSTSLGSEAANMPEPSSPDSPSPQAQTLPSSSSAAMCSAPHPTCTTRVLGSSESSSRNASTTAGWGWSTRSPWPRAPWRQKGNPP
mmetsp:Transcript_22043/g.83867  ORF Transcript_22043/g.83867 Transcript_22043/m.83867 type:complete len:220 (-) Transcript_22043:500-1159(-)